MGRGSKKAIYRRGNTKGLVYERLSRLAITRGKQFKARYRFIPTIPTRLPKLDNGSLGENRAMRTFMHYGWEFRTSNFTPGCISQVNSLTSPIRDQVLESSLLLLLWLLLWWLSIEDNWHICQWKRREINCGRHLSWSIM